jgi:hypothetical protein
MNFPEAFCDHAGEIQVGEHEIHHKGRGAAYRIAMALQ